MKVKDVYETLISECVTIESGALIYQAIEKILEMPEAHYVYVVDKKGVLKGTVVLRDLIRITSARYGIRKRGFGSYMKYLSDILKDDVDEVARPPLPVSLDDNVSKAMKIMESYDLSNLPVVDKQNKVIGELNGTEILKFALEGVKKGDLLALEQRRLAELEKQSKSRKKRKSTKTKGKKKR
jgi:CBS domain-containing protein